MPELPEVETVVRTLQPSVVGSTISQVRHVRRDMVHPRGFGLETALTGRTVEQAHRRAKRIVMELDDGNRFYIHLGMSGRLTVEESAAAIAPHTHLILDLRTSGGPSKRAAVHRQLRFRDPRRFGGIFWLGREADDIGLGPEPLTLRASKFAKLLAKTRRPIKSALLDQRLIAGLGNIYADEALFDARIHPQTPSNALSQRAVGKLTRSIKQVLRRAILFKGSTLRDFVDAKGIKGSYRRHHQVYNREGQRCPNCQRHLIQRIVLGGRSTCFCPDCQSQ